MKTDMEKQCLNMKTYMEKQCFNSGDCKCITLWYAYTRNSRGTLMLAYPLGTLYKATCLYRQSIALPSLYQLLFWDKNLYYPSSAFTLYFNFYKDLCSVFIWGIFRSSTWSLLLDAALFQHAVASVFLPLHSLVLTSPFHSLDLFCLWQKKISFPMCLPTAFAFCGNETSQLRVLFDI